MKLGLLSDTHGHVERTRRALALLTSRSVGHLIHCGDVGSDLVLDLLLEQQETGTPVTVVPGNVDEWDPGIGLYARSLGVAFHQLARLELEGKHIAVHHGHDPRQMEELTGDAGPDLLFTGHTHLARDEQEGRTRVINPGAVYRASVPSVAVVELGQAVAVEFLPLFDE